MNGTQAGHSVLTNGLPEVLEKFIKDSESGRLNPRVAGLGKYDSNKNKANNRVQRTRHKVSGPLTRDVRLKNE